MEQVKAMLKHILTEGTAWAVENLERCQSIRKLVAEGSLRERGVFPDKKGYELELMLLRATRAVRELDLAAAEVHVRDWKKCAQERMDKQLFDQSASCFVDALTGELTRGTDEATRQLGEWTKGWSAKLDGWIEAILVLSV